MDFSANNSKCKVANASLYMNYSWIIILELILGLPLNITALYTFIFRLRFYKANKNMVFLFNLVLADFLLLACLPLKVYQFQRGERCSKSLGLCKAMFFMQFMNRGASIAFMTIITIDRYLSVVHPRKKNILKVVKQSPKFSIIVWLLLPLLAIPAMINTIKCDEGNRPDEDITDILRETVFFTKILVPFIILVFCTVRIVQRLQKTTVGEQTKLRRAVFAVTAVVVVYSICFLPHAASRIVLLVMRSEKDPKDLETAAEVYEGIYSFSQIDCLLDTLVYCFYSSKFKNAYLSTFCPCLRKYNQHNEK